jgi:hypothetical protein
LRGLGLASFQVANPPGDRTLNFIWHQLKFSGISNARQL